MPILSLLAKLGIDGRGFKAGLKEAEAATNKFAGNLKTQLAAAFSVAAAGAFVKGLADTVGRIKDLGDQYGITTDEVQKADVALRQNGLQFENLGQSLQKVGQARRDAVEGNDELRDSFARYGVTLADLNNPQLRNYDLILKIAAAIKDQNLTARDQVELTDLLGHRSLKLLTTLQELHKFDSLKIFTAEDVQRIDQANKKLEELHRRLKVFAAESLTAIPSMRFSDFWTPLFKPEFLEKLGVDSTATPGADAGPMSKEGVAAANAAKHLRMQQEAEAGKETLFEVDKKDKQKKRKSDLLGFASGLVYNVPKPSGFAAGGGFSGAVATLDPRMHIEEGQLQELRHINSGIAELNRKIDRGPTTQTPFRR